MALRWMGAASVVAAALALHGATAMPSLRTTSQIQQLPWAMNRYEYATRRLASSASGDDTMNDAVNQANEVGAKVRDTIKKLRGGNEQFYMDLISTLKIVVCNAEPKNADRFVDKSDPKAYKTDSGDCIRVTVTDLTDDNTEAKYDMELCETKPNCFWGPINDGDYERTPVYSTKEGLNPPEGAMTLDEANQFLIKWATGLMGFVVPGIILAVLSLLTMIFFLICRCCCNRCGGRKAKEGGYTCLQKFLPVLFYLLFAIAVIICAGVSLLYQKTIVGSVGDIFTHTIDTFDDAGAWIVDLRTPLEAVRDKVVESAGDVQVQLSNTGFIDTGLDGLTGKLDDFADSSAGRTLPEGCVVSNADPFCLPCVVCTTINEEVGKASGQIEDNAGKGVGDLKKVKEDLDSLLVGIAGNVKDQVNAQVDNSEVFIEMINTTRDQVKGYRGDFDKQQKPQQAGVLGLFTLALLTIVLGLIGVLFGLTPLKFLANIIHLAYIIGFLALIITFLVAAIMLALSVVLGDVCEVTLIFQKDWTPALGSDAKMVNACFQNQSLIDVFNLSSSLEFARGGVQFPDLELASMLDFSDLDGFANSIKETNASTFKLDENAMAQALVLFNQYVKQSDNACLPNDVYTMNNILEPWTANNENSNGVPNGGGGGTGTGNANGKTPEQYITARYTKWDAACKTPGDGKPFTCTKGQNPCTFSAYIGEVYHQVSSLRKVQRDSGQFIVDLHANITKVTDFTTAFKANITDMTGRIDDIKVDLEASLIKHVHTFENEMYCYFLAEDFSKIFKSFCGDLMPALTMISILVFLAGLFLIPVNICLIIAVKRLKARGNGSHVMDNEMKFK